MGWVHFPSSFTVFYGATILKDDTPMSQKYEMTRVSSLEKGNIFHVSLCYCWGNIQNEDTDLHTEASLFHKSVQVSTVQNMQFYL